MSESVKVGLIGAGFVSEMHLRAFQSAVPDAAVVDAKNRSVLLSPKRTR